MRAKKRKKQITFRKKPVKKRTVCLTHLHIPSTHLPWRYRQVRFDPLKRRFARISENRIFLNYRAGVPDQRTGRGRGSGNGASKEGERRRGRRPGHLALGRNSLTSTLMFNLLDWVTRIQ